MDKYWSKDDREYHTKITHLEKTSINLEDMLSYSNDFVIVRGIAGIGKTSLVDSYVLRWAQQEILNGAKNSPQVDFLFKLTCRHINTLSETDTAETLLRAEYSKVCREYRIGRFARYIASHNNIY